MFLLWKIITAVHILTVFMNCQFENQYLGHHYTREEYNKLDIGCDTTICLNDAQRLLLAATQNHTIKPCDDFKEFAMGRFDKLGALHERYEYIGFDNDVQLLDWERYRKLLASRINETDIKSSKIAKNYYQKCVNSDNVRENGTAEVLKYVSSFGGAPFLNSSWDEDSYNVEGVFKKEVKGPLLISLNQWIDRCPHPKNDSQTIVCLETISPAKYSDVETDELVFMFKQIGVDKKVIQSVIKKSNTYFTIQRELRNIVVTPGIFTISQLNSYTNNTFNWLKIINSLLTIESQLTDDSEIFIKKPEVILKLLEFMRVTPKRILADMFAFEFLFRHKELFIVYALDEFEKQLYGRIKSYQRWEQCLHHLLQQHGPALQALHAVTYFNKEIQDSVKEFTKEAVHDFIVEVNKLNIDRDTKKDVVGKLNNIKYIIGYPEEVLDLQKIEILYEELELNGTEGLVETFLKMKRNSEKIKNNPSSNWKIKALKMSARNLVSFVTDDNSLYVPPRLIHYPYYHPNRSRFFNTATFFVKTVEGLNGGIKNLLNSKQFLRINPQNVGFINYVKWEESGGKELQLPGFFLTNQQMYWVARAHVSFTKHHPHGSLHENPNYYSFLKNFHIFYKNNLLFRKTFNCSEPTKEEEKKTLKYEKELKEGSLKITQKYANS